MFWHIGYLLWTGGCIEMELGDKDVTYMSLPPNFQTEENHALGYAFDRQVKKIMEAAKNIPVWTNLDNIPEKYYDYIAASIRAPYYSSQYDAETRKGILKSAFQVYMFAGTCRGVEELISRIFLGAALFVPWYEYGGKAFHFRISVHGSPVRDTLNKFKEILKRVKAKRSVLDAIEYIIGFNIYIPEKINVPIIEMRTFLFFWDCDVLDGSRLLDGSVLLCAQRRYNLVSWIKYSGIRLPVQSSADVLAILIKGVMGAGRQQDIKAGIGYYSRADFWEQAGRGQTGYGNGKTNMGFKTAIETHENIGEVLITYKRNLCYLDGSVLLDGSKLLNAFYLEEEV